MSSKKILSILGGFVFLFAVYHFPEFFQAFWIAAVFKIGFLLAAFFLAKMQGWNGLAGYGLGLKSGWWRIMLKGVAIGLLGFGTSVFLAQLFGYEKIIAFSPLASVVAQLPMLLLMTAIPSVAEDILTRGYLFGHLGDKMKIASWMLLSAVLFVLNHIWRLHDGPAVLSYLFFLGLLLAFTVWESKSLWMAFGIHWGSNLAFESSRSLLNSESLVSHQGNTWLLALVWATVLGMMLWGRKRKSAVIAGG